MSASVKGLKTGNYLKWQMNLVTHSFITIKKLIFYKQLIRNIFKCTSLEMSKLSSAEIGRMLSSDR